MEKYFSSLAPWRELLSGEFNRGYLTGVSLVLGIVLLLLVLKIVLMLIFRRRRARCIVVRASDGDTVISQDAVDSALDLILCRFPDLVLESIRIYIKGKHAYIIELKCRFLAGSIAFPDIVAKVKEAIFSGMETQFGIRDLKKVRIVLVSWDGKAAQSQLRNDPLMKVAMEPESIFKEEGDTQEKAPENTENTQK